MKKLHHLFKPVHLMFGVILLILMLLILVPVFDDSLASDISSLPNTKNPEESKPFQIEWMKEWVLWLMAIFVIPVLILAGYLYNVSRKRNERKFLEFKNALSRLVKERQPREEGDFKLKLLKKHPHLSSYDLDLSALLLDHSSKEIAQKLNISPSSVNTARYRLRKKLNLESGDDLVSYLLKFNA
ncbi:hypothetical protein E0K83_17380 [Gramella sp. BOM4]|nr:hypothetical protein [Christiangramia bathymodioli]